MSKEYMAEKTSSHKAMAIMPDLMIPPGSTIPIPCITTAMFGGAKKTAKKTHGNNKEIFTKASYVPKCIGGIPGAKGIKSGKWNGKFEPTECSKGATAEGQGIVYNGHKGKINNGNALAIVITTMSIGAPPVKEDKALALAQEDLKEQANAEFVQDKAKFLASMGSSAMEALEGFKNVAGIFAMAKGAHSAINAIMESPVQAFTKQNSNAKPSAIFQVAADNNELSEKIQERIHIIDNADLMKLEDVQAAKDVINRVQETVAVAVSLDKGHFAISDIVDTADSLFSAMEAKDKLALTEQIVTDTQAGQASVVIGHLLGTLHESAASAADESSVDISVYDLISRTHTIKNSRI